MANSEHLARLRKGFRPWNNWRCDHPDEQANLSEAKLDKADLSRANLSEAKLDKADLSRANLREADLSRANLSEAKLDKADLFRANLSEAKLDKADLSRANLSEADLSRANLSEAKLTKADLSKADLSEANLRGANLRWASLSEAYFYKASLEGADLSGARLPDADLSRADFSRVDLSMAYLPDALLIEADLSGADLGSAKLRRAILTSANLTQADLSHADLSGANLPDALLGEADLSRAKLPDANLAGADLGGANLSGADLSGAKLPDAHLNRVDLSGADLSRADLSRADLIHANLSRADLCAAILDSAACGTTNFGGVASLCEAIGLGELDHRAPSSLGTDTLVAARGRLPEVFLEGCGLQRWEIESSKLYDPALNATEISELLTSGIFDARTDGPLFIGGTFLSYSHVDSEFVLELYERFKKEDVRVWLDRHDMIAGSIEQQVTRGIRLNDVVVVVLSASSLSSKSVWDEIETAVEKEEAENRDILCPISLDGAWEENPLNKRRLMRTIRDRYVVPFGPDQDFETQFGKLLNGMKINYEVSNTPAAD